MDLIKKRTIENEILPFLSPAIKQIMQRMNSGFWPQLEEIRLRNGQPLLLKVGEKYYGLEREGALSEKLCRCYVVGEEDIYRSLASISDNSLYAFEEEIKRGFITIPGGHRVGLSGQVILAGSEVRTMKDFSGVAFRMAREVEGCSQSLLPYIYSADAQPLSTLIISAPGCGKTTLLRDLTRHISTGNRWGQAVNVTVIDERSELAGSYRGKAQFDLGPRTDVIDACPKAVGMIMAIRSLSPRVVVTDEIGRREDIEAIEECANAGVAVLTSLHARNADEAKKRPKIKELLAEGHFPLLVVLSRRQGPGTVEEIIRWE